MTKALRTTLKKSTTTVSPLPSILLDCQHLRETKPSSMTRRTSNRRGAPRPQLGTRSASHATLMDGTPPPPSTENPSPMYTELQSKAVFKYPRQSRLCLGVAAIKKIDGTVLGRKSKVFGYTSKCLISIQEWQRRIGEEIKRVKGLKSNVKRSKWVGTS